MSRRTRLRGVTLIEALIALAITVVLLASAIPAFQGALDRQRLSGTTNDLVLAIILARAEATSRHTRVAVTPQRGSDWSTGWHVFVDANDNGRLDPGEMIVRTFEPVPPRMSIAAAFGAFDGHVLSFDHFGLLRRPGSNGLVLGRLTLTLAGSARTLCFSAASVRTVQATACT